MTDEVRCNASDDDLHQVRCGGVREGADKQRLEQQLAELNLVLNQQAAYIATLETENAQRTAKGTTYLDLIKALNDANQQLEANVATLDQKVQARTKEYNDQLWQYNRSVVLMQIIACRTTGINARSGVHTPRSTLAAWSGAGGASLTPLGPGMLKTASARTVLEDCCNVRHGRDCALEPRLGGGDHASFVCPCARLSSTNGNAPQSQGIGCAARGSISITRG